MDSPELLPETLGFGRRNEWNIDLSVYYPNRMLRAPCVMLWSKWSLLWQNWEQVRKIKGPTRLNLHLSMMVYPQLISFLQGIVGPVNLLRRQLYITCAPRLLAKHGNRWQQFMGTHLGGEMGWWEFKSKFWTPVIEFSLGSNFKTNNSWNLVFEEYNAAIWGFCLPPPYVTISTPSNSQIRSLTTPPPLVIVFL